MTPINRPTDDHHWIALWLLLAGGCVLAVTGAARVGIESFFGGTLFGAGFVWLMLVD